MRLINSGTLGSADGYSGSRGGDPEGKRILVDINPEFEGGAVSGSFSRSGKTAYMTGHEIGAHANRMSRGITASQNEDHLKWTGQNSAHTTEYDGNSTSEGQLLQQIGNNEKQ